MKAQAVKKQATVKDLKILVESAEKLNVPLSAAILKRLIKEVK